MRRDKDKDLESELRELGARIEYPPTPDLARSVRRRLAQEERPATRGRLLALPPRWAAAAAVIAVFLAVPVLSPAARDALSGWIVAEQGLGGGAQSASDAGGSEPAGAPATSENAEQRGAPEEAGGPLPSSAGSSEASSPLGEGLGLGEPITWREARAVAGEVFVPEIGEPDEIYAEGPESVVLVYHARPGMPSLGDTEIGLVLTELPGEVESAYFPPQGPRSDAGIEQVRVGGERGLWIPAGNPAAVDRTGGLPANVLLWEREGRALRLETGLPRERAIRIAESTR